jgi:bacterioferritin-associated ferredoxin
MFTGHGTMITFRRKLFCPPSVVYHGGNNMYPLKLMSPFRVFYFYPAQRTPMLVLSETIKGMNIRDAYNIKPEDIVERLGGLPDYKIHCSVLGDKALRTAIDDYLAKTGRAGMLKEEAVEICHCLGITDKDIENAFQKGSRTWEELQQATKIGTVCGGCKEKALELLHEFAHIYGT